MSDAIAEPSHLVQFGVEGTASDWSVEGMTKSGLPKATLVTDPRSSCLTDA